MLLWLTNCQSQTERVETKIFNCINQSFPNNGNDFNKTILQFENELIEQHILKDRTGKSYREIYKQIYSETEIEFKPSKVFTDSIRSVNKYYFQIFLDCEGKYMNTENYINSKTNKLKTALESLNKSGKFEPKIIAKVILSNLDNNDFELDYYKFRTIQIVNFINVSFNTNNKNDILMGDIENAFKIHIDRNNGIFVNDKKVSVEQLRLLIKKYEKENKTESIFLVKANSEALYKTFIKVNNAINDEINSLRNQLAIEKYNMNFNQLSEKQKKGIIEIYPQKVKEQ